jgi:hypothetical protein
MNFVQLTRGYPHYPHANGPRLAPGAVHQQARTTLPKRLSAEAADSLPGRKSASRASSLFLLCALCALFGYAVFAQAAPPPITLAWNPLPSQYTNVSYTVFCGTNSGSYQTNQVTTNTTVSFSLPAGTTYFFAVQATMPNSSPSPLSAEISWTLLPQVTGVRVIIITAP